MSNTPTLPQSPLWTALWKQSHSGSWAPPSARTLSGTITLTVLQNWGWISFAKWGSLTFHKNCSPSSTQPPFSLSCVHLTVWFDSAIKSGIRILRQTARPTEKIIGTPQPNHQEMYTSRVRKRTEKNHSGPSHPAYFLFILLPSGWRYRALSTKTARHKNSFFHQAIFHLNNTVELHICT